MSDDKNTKPLTIEDLDRIEAVEKTTLSHKRKFDEAQSQIAMPDEEGANPSHVDVVEANKNNAEKTTTI